MRTVEFVLSDLAATERLARRVAAVARVGDLIALKGDLGSGKTTFARFFLRAVSGRENEEVPSPTFNLLLVYSYPNLTVWHFDLYRLRAPEEAYELGVDDALAEGVALVEWPERLGTYLPAARLDLRLAESTTPDARHVTLAASGPWRDRLTLLVENGR